MVKWVHMYLVEPVRRWDWMIRWWLWFHQMTLYQLQYNVCIDTWSLRHLTSAEEYPDDEYLDMSKSSSL